tara:strand:- start:25100 stop:25642 length:543 start_codon:yes stop_codon:yes gene_type:complete
MMADYLEALGDFPEPVLERAAREVRLAWTRPTWPFAGVFREACQKLMHGEPTARISPPDGRLARSAQAWDYVRRRMFADNGRLFLRASKALAVNVLERWLFDQACADLREGREPHISDAQVEEGMVAWERQAEQTKAYWDEMAKKPSDISVQAKHLVKRAREAMAASPPAAPESDEEFVL